MPRPNALLSSEQRSRGASPGGDARTSARALRTTAVAAAAMTFLLIAVGGLVRATGSGEGCTGWPKCSPGRWLPPLEYHAIIEYSHRMTAFVDIVVVAALAVVAWRGYRDVPRVVRPAATAVLLIIAQAVLGGIVVKGALAPLLVTAHFATAMILAAVLVYAAVAAYTLRSRPSGTVDGPVALARTVAAGAFALLLVGAYVRGENAGLVFADWPLMNGRAVPSISSVPAGLQFTHRLLALGVGLGVAWLAARMWRKREGHAAAATLALAAVGLFIVQILLGAALVWTGKSAAAVVAHVAVSSLAWGALVATAATARMRMEPVAHSDGDHAVPELATPA